MQKIITAQNKNISVNWCGASTIDFALRFSVKGMSMTEVLTIFMNPEETETLIHVFDEKKATYTGYTTFRGVDLKPDGSIVVALKEGIE